MVVGAGDDDEVHKQSIISRARHENGSGSDPSSLIDRQTTSRSRHSPSVKLLMVEMVITCNILTWPVP